MRQTSSVGEDDWNSGRPLFYDTPLRTASVLSGSGLFSRRLKPTGPKESDRHFLVIILQVLSFTSPKSKCLRGESSFEIPKRNYLIEDILWLLFIKLSRKFALLDTSSYGWYEIFSEFSALPSRKALRRLLNGKIKSERYAKCCRTHIADNRPGRRCAF